MRVWGRSSCSSTSSPKVKNSRWRSLQYAGVGEQEMVPIQIVGKGSTAASCMHRSCLPRAQYALPSAAHQLMRPFY